MNIFARCICIMILVLCRIASMAQDNISALIPQPLMVELPTNEKSFDLRKAGRLQYPADCNPFLVKELTTIIEERCGLSIAHTGKGLKIELRNMHSDTMPEGYTIDISSKELIICGNSERGIFYALKTLDQILLGDVFNSREGKIAPIRIEDRPRYAHRAVMLDPARHFLPVDDVKLFIDQMARFKYNVLQLHLTDDQGWRIEIKSHPELTEKGAFRTAGASPTPDNGFYTQEQLKEIIEYASDRYIEIIPELDIPGHSVAILASHPELGCAFRHDEPRILGKTTNMMLCAHNRSVYDIYEDIIGEVSALFPSEYIHLGGDEAAVGDNWAKCDHCKALMEKHDYNNPSQLMNIFFGKMLDIVRRNNKTAILWCELDNIYPPANDYLFPYPSDVILVTWRNGLTPKCIELTRKNGHKLIMAPGEHTYLDYPQWNNDLPEYNNWGMPITTLEKSYELNPGYNTDDSHITGVMATLWGEAIKDINRVFYMFFPRGIAIAEAAWSAQERRCVQSFKERLYPNLFDLMKHGISFRVPFELSR